MRSPDAIALCSNSLAAARSRRHAFRRVLLALLSLLIVAGAAFALIGGEAGASCWARRRVCPPGYLGEKQLELRERREQRARGETEKGDAERKREEALGEGSCRAGKGPEPIGELMQIQTESGRRARGGQGGVKTGAYASAVADAKRIATASGTLPGSAGAWTPAGKGPLIGDDERYDEVNGQGLADQNGRPSDFAFDPKGRRLYAAVGEGGVWAADEKAGFDDWRSIGERLPTQAVGGIDSRPPTAARVIVFTGDDVFGGGDTFSGLGVFSHDRRRRDVEAGERRPGRALGFRLEVDPTIRSVVYAATGAGLYRSADGGAAFANVNLPTGRASPSGQPNCTGAAPDKEGCALANMVTDVVVQRPRNDKTAGAAPGTVVAAVGWRAGNKQSPASKSYPGGFVEAPNNGIYRSGDGAPARSPRSTRAPPGCRSAQRTGSPSRNASAASSSATPRRRPGSRLPLRDRAGRRRFSGGSARSTSPTDEHGPRVPSNTVLNGIYVSPDFGKTWTPHGRRRASSKAPSSGSALTGTACAAALLPGRAGLVQPVDRAGPDAPDGRRRPDAARVRPRGGLGERGRPAAERADALQGRRPLLLGGDTCLFLNTGLPECPTTPAPASTTTHPDQQDGIWIPDGDGGVTLTVGNDGGFYRTTSAPAQERQRRLGHGPTRLQHAAPLRRAIANDGTSTRACRTTARCGSTPDRQAVRDLRRRRHLSEVDPSTATSPTRRTRSTR